MERGTGEEFYFMGYRMEVKRSDSGSCAGCFFYQHQLPCRNKKIQDVTGECMKGARQDHRHVIFIEVI